MQKNSTAYFAAMFFLFFGLVCSKTLSSQKYFFDNYGVKEGLGHSKVKVIIQSSDAYIWLGTTSGLSRFDGENFTNFTIDDGIAPFGVSALLEDTVGTIWIGHFSGNLSIYRDHKFSVIKLDSVNGDVTDIELDSKGRMWITTSGSGVYRVDKPYEKNIVINAHLSSKEGIDNIIFSCVNTKSLGMLFVTRYGVKFYNKKIQAYEFVNEQFFAWPQYFNIIKVVEDKAGGLWVGTFNGGLYYYKDINTKPEIYDRRDGLADNWVSDIYIAKDSTVWIASFNGGISHFANDTMITYNEANGLPENKINCITGDIEGNILIGTYSNGISIYKGSSFLNYSRFIEDKAIQVNCVSKGKQSDFWFGTNEGLFHYFTEPDQKSQTVVYRKDGINLQSNDIRFLKKDKEGNQWIGTSDGGIAYFDIAKKKIVYPFIPNQLLNQANNFIPKVTALEFDQHGDLWIGSLGGLIYYNIKENSTALITQSQNLQNNDISSLYCDDNGILWIGHRGKGLTRLEGTEFVPYNIGLEVTPTCISGNDKELWIGTEGMGLLVVRDKLITNHYNIENGLQSNLITALSIDEDGNIIIGTNLGLNKLNVQTGNLLAFGAKDGFVGIEVKPNAFYKESNGNIWSGTAEGVTKIFSKLLKANELPPITRITRLRINLEDRDLVQSMELPYQDNSILIDYKSLCISDASKVAYKVRLLGAEEEWQPITEQTYANYPALPPGDYTFQVIARNNSNIWNEEPQKFSFTITPPFWQTIWFYSIVLFVFIVGVVLFIKIRERQLKLDKAELEMKVEERTAEVQEKSNQLAKKNKDITDSINYARRIQRAVMPPTTQMEELLKSSFIFYKPKDIVSGDFHWNTYHNNRLIVAAADCTGHGVPGAFMSMISISSLNKVVKEKQIVDPARILDHMRYDIVNDLKQSGDVQAKDGLDIALLSIEPESRIVHYAGAYNSLYIIKAKPINEEELNFDFNYSLFSDRLIEVKADRMPIGISERMDSNFTTKTIQLEPGDSIYISTDGYIDQFGGENGKKLMSKKFKQLLLELPYSKPEESLQSLEYQFITWRGKHEQIDDVLVIGICF